MDLPTMRSHWTQRNAVLVPSIIRIQRSHAHLKCNKNAQGPTTTCLGPKADVQFPQLWLSILTTAADYSIFVPECRTRLPVGEFTLAQVWTCPHGQRGWPGLLADVGMKQTSGHTPGQRDIPDENIVGYPHCTLCGNIIKNIALRKDASQRPFIRLWRRQHNNGRWL